MLPNDIGDYQPVVTSNRHWPNTTGAITWVHTISPTLTNEVLLNVSRDYHWRGSGDRHTNYAGALGLPNPFDAFNWPSITDLGIPPAAAATLSVRQPGAVLADHQLRAAPGQRHQDPRQARVPVRRGFRYEMIDKSAIANAGPFSANTLATSLYNPASTPQNPIAAPQTGFGLANFMLGALNYHATFRRPLVPFPPSGA